MLKKLLIYRFCKSHGDLKTIFIPTFPSKTRRVPSSPAPLKKNVVSLHPIFESVMQ